MFVALVTYFATTTSVASAPATALHAAPHRVAEVTKKKKKKPPPPPDPADDDGEIVFGPDDGTPVTPTNMTSKTDDAKTKTKPKAKPPSKPAPKPAPKPPVDDVTPDDTTANDAVTKDADDVTSGTPAATDDIAATPSTDDEPTPTLGLRAAIGFGVVQRAFSPTTNAATAYDSSGVAAVRVEGELRAARWFELAIAADRAIGLTTEIIGHTDNSTLSSWRATGEFIHSMGNVELGGILGMGQRDFSVDENAADHATEAHYVFLQLGADLRATIRPWLIAHASVSFEPVIDSSQPMELTAALGQAQLWGLEVAAGAEFHRGPLYLALLGSYQRFSWTWAGAGTRGGNGAVDTIPTFIASVGAQY